MTVAIQMLDAETLNSIAVSVRMPDAGSLNSMTLVSSTAQNSMAVSIPTVDYFNVIT